jgi:hypothetical protein
MTMIPLTPRRTRIVATVRVVHVNAAVCPHAPKAAANLPQRRPIQLVIGRFPQIKAISSHLVQCASSLSAPQQTNSKPIGRGLPEAA